MRSKKYLTKASAPAGVWALAAAGMLGSVVRVAVALGEADGVVAVVVGDEAAVLEDEAWGLLSPPHPASNIDAANGTASNAAEVFFTAKPTSLSLQRSTAMRPSAGTTTLGGTSETAKREIPLTTHVQYAGPGCLRLHCPQAGDIEGAQSAPSEATQGALEVG